MTSVGTTKKIIRAMGMVAASKLQRERPRLIAARSYFGEATKMIDDLRRSEDAREHAFFTRRAVQNTAYVVITSDRGLCGSYNVNLITKTLAHMKGKKDEKIIAIGFKGYEQLKRRNKNILLRYVDVLDTGFHKDAERIAGYLSSLYASGEIDEAYVAFTKFETALSHRPSIEKVLPIGLEKPVYVGGMQYEKSAHFYADHAIPLYLGAFIYAALHESIACEQAARMISTDTSTHNAADIIQKLTRVYNRRRQASITQEISEIVSSASMLKDTKHYQ